MYVCERDRQRDRQTEGIEIEEDRRERDGERG